mmetsp:Transcript_20058/g.47215  ORF Transcript_20058/g.47215 Transcript_20058/m.47215 type:complete len:86 (-) Transcript_20058:955-1212(-)
MHRAHGPPLWNVQMSSEEQHCRAKPSPAQCSYDWAQAGAGDGVAGAGTDVGTEVVVAVMGSSVGAVVLVLVLEAVLPGENLCTLF